MVLAAVIVAVVPCIMAAAGEARVALVIGNAKYEHAPLLNNPLNDAADVTAAFQRLGFAVTVLENADESELRHALKQFGRAAAAAQFALIYYAGHGIEVDHRNFLVPVDARLASDADVEFEAVPLDLVLQSLSRAAFRLVILDACRENPFARTMQSAGTTRSIGRGLALIEPPGGMLVAYSAKEGTLAEDGDGRNSPYAQALLRVLTEKPDLEVGIMFRHVRDDVLAATGGRQEPFTYGSLPKDGIYFQPTSQDLSPEPESGPDARSAPSAVVNQPSPAALVVDEVDEIRWALSAAQVYSNPDAGSAVVDDLHPAVEVEVTGVIRDSGWLRIVLDGGGVGFVAGAVLIDRYPVDEVEGVYHVERPANVRSGPGVGYQKVGRLERGDVVTATGRFLESDWLRIVLDGGDEGYVTAPMLSGRFPVDEVEGVYRAAQAVEVRSGFGIGWQTTATLEPGTEVEVTGRTRVAGIDWLRISRVGAEGYVNAQGMRDTEADEAAFATATERGTIGAYQTYLRNHPHGRHSEEAQRLHAAKARTARADAQRREDDAAYERARRTDTDEAYRDYLAEYPRGRHIAQAQEQLATMGEREDDAAYERAQNTDTVAGFALYLRSYPQGRHAVEARRRQTELLFELQAREDDEAYQRAQSAATATAYDGYLRRFPNGRHAEAARRVRATILDDAAYEAARTVGTSAAYSAYLNRYPSGRHAQDALRLQALARDDESYERARRTDTASAYEAYLRRYPNGRHANDARRQQEERRIADRFRPGDRFRDCDVCPELVVVPEGNYMMGSPDSEKWRTRDEGPRHRVTIDRPFAVGVGEITVREYGRFVEATGRAMQGTCRQWREGEWKLVGGTGWRFPGFSQTEQAPVVCVNWEDANAYVKWLTGVTGEAYRLLSESEWEYVARAGTDAATFWGHDVKSQCRYANGVDLTLKRKDREWQWTYASCSDGHHTTAPVGTFVANKFGLHDVIGNVWEWTQDCWHNDYQAAPTDGRAWQGDDCSQRVARGGSWLSRPTYLRLAIRLAVSATQRSAGIGFRIRRTIAH